MLRCYRPGMKRAQSTSQIFDELLARFFRLICLIVEPVFAEKRSDLGRHDLPEPCARVIDCGASRRRYIRMANSELWPQSVVSCNLLVQELQAASDVLHEGFIDPKPVNEPLLPAFIELRIEVNEGKTAP